MRTILTLITCCALSSTALAKSDYNVKWSVSGIQDVNELSLDINAGTEFLTANGSVVLSNGNSIPVVGTCLFTLAGGVFCSFSYQQGKTITLDLEPTIDGTWRTRDLSGHVIQSGTLTKLRIL